MDYTTQIQLTNPVDCFILFQLHLTVFLSLYCLYQQHLTQQMFMLSLSFLPTKLGANKKASDVYASFLVWSAQCCVTHEMQKNTFKAICFIVYRAVLQGDVINYLKIDTILLLQIGVELYKIQIN